LLIKKPKHFIQWESILRWEVKTGNSEGFIGQGPSSATCGSLQGDTLYIGGSDDGVYLNPVGSGKVLEYGSKIAVSGACTGIVSGTKDATLTIAVTKKVIVLIRSGKSVFTEKVAWEPLCVDLSVDNTHCAVGGSDNHIHIFSVSSDKLTEVDQLKWHRAPVNVVKYAPNGTQIASSDSTSRVVGIWDLKSKTLIQDRWQNHSAKVNSIDWASDSQSLITGSLDSNIILWKVNDPTKPDIYNKAHFGGVFGVAFVDDTTFVSTGNDCTAKVWTIKK